MKVFEKYALQDRKKPVNPQIAILHSWHDQKIAEKYWRAALEWALTEECYGRVESDIIRNELNNNQ